MSILLDNVDAAGGQAISSTISSSGGTYIAVIRADGFGDGTVYLEAKSNNDDKERWAVLTNGSFTEEDTKELTPLKPGLQLRARFSSDPDPTQNGAVTGASNVYVELI